MVCATKYNRKYCRVREFPNRNKSRVVSINKVANSGRRWMCLCCGVGGVRRQGSSVRFITLYGNSVGTSRSRGCVSRGAGGRQGSGGADDSTARAGQEGHCRQLDGTESTQDSRWEASWQLTTAERALVSDSYRGTIIRCVQLLRNLTGTAVLDCDLYLVIVLMCFVYDSRFYISMRIFLEDRLVIVGVEVIRHE
jgi:hypothetical protein